MLTNEDGKMDTDGVAQGTFRLSADMTIEQREALDQDMLADLARPVDWINLPVVVLPWREFKAYVQLFERPFADLPYGEDDAVRLRYNRDGLLRNLVASLTPAGARSRAILFKYGLVEQINEWISPRYDALAVPLGWERRVEEANRAGQYWIEAGRRVVPEARSANGIAWRRSEGRSGYCGTELSFRIGASLFTLSSDTDSEGQRLASCKGCHASRATGTRTLEDYRFDLEQAEYEKKRGVRFTQAQVTSCILPSLTWIKAGMLPCRSSRVCSLTAASGPVSPGREVQRLREHHSRHGQEAWQRA